MNVERFTTNLKQRWKTYKIERAILKYIQARNNFFFHARARVDDDTYMTYAHQQMRKSEDDMRKYYCKVVDELGQGVVYKGYHINHFAHHAIWSLIVKE
jgi:hypothetical protein